MQTVRNRLLPARAQINRQTGIKKTDLPLNNRITAIKKLTCFTLFPAIVLPGTQHHQPDEKEQSDEYQHDQQLDHGRDKTDKADYLFK